MKKLKIAIDATTAAGATSIAESLSDILNIKHIDPKLMYKALSLKIFAEGISPYDEIKCKGLLINTHIDVFKRNGKQFILLDGSNVADKIVSPFIESVALNLSRLPLIRAEMVKNQKVIARDGGIIDGKDISDVVLPDANYKIFLTADLLKRAERRYKDFKKNESFISFEDVLKDTIERDRRDVNNYIAPLSMSKDAALINNTDLNINQTVNACLGIINKGEGTSYHR